MSHQGDTSGAADQPADPELLLRTTVFVLLGVIGVVVGAAADSWWTTALAFGGVAFAVAGIVLSVARMLSHEEDASASGPDRVRALALAAITAVALILAVALPEHAAGSTATPRAQAAQTVRDFLIAAVVDDSPYVACQYLTASAQQDVARLGGPGATCRDTFTATKPSFDGVESVHDVKRLDMRVAVRGNRAQVTVVRSGSKPAAFGLRRATAAELSTYEAPQVPWRIASGVTAVLA